MELFITIYILINILAFLLMKVDKKRAVNHEWRIAESKLWTVSFIGGALGAWMGMRTYRHKTKHFPFKYGLPFITILQVALISYILIVLT
ncbi:DUF1294 domain-containing protein [Bacillus haimaensis]|uniref:DUF1294 domain-containing protein n=1 Tax=Bacillus haimaensis TaxID=3160967 RepID=UPI003AA992CC